MLEVINLLMDELRELGYIDPNSEVPMEGLAKDNKGFIEGLSIQQLNADGQPLETWTVKGAFMTSLAFSRLDYGSDDITEITIEVAYDYATFDLN